jgi:sodium transport system permease protein
MNTRLVKIVYCKELLEALRDRRTLISTILVPMLIFPLLIFGFGSLAARSVQRVQKEGFTVMILGATNSPGLVAALKNTEGLTIIEPKPDYAERISNKKLRTALEIPPAFEKQLREFGTFGTNRPVIKLYHYAGEMRSQFALRTVQKTLRDYSDTLVETRLIQSGLSKEVLKPFEIRDQNVAAPEKVGGNLLGGVIPYIIIFLSFVGALTPAIDVTAGEKERGTIETILASPVSRMELATGKFLMVLTASLITTMMSLTSFAVSFSLPFFAAREMSRSGPNPLHFDLSASAMAAVFVLVLPLAVMFAAILLAIALHAKSYKEAQSYTHPLMMVILLPAMAAMLPGLDLNLGLAFVPILNVSLISKEVLSGNYQWAQIVIVLASSCLYAVFALLATRSAFNRESVLFRS